MPNCQGTKKPTTSPTIHYSQCVFPQVVPSKTASRVDSREYAREPSESEERTNERTREQARQIEQLAWGKFALGLGQRQRCGAQLQRAFNLLR